MEKDTTTYVGLDDSKRKLVVAILRPGEREPEQREMPKESHLIQRLFRRLTREGAVAVCYEAGVSGYDLYVIRPDGTGRASLDIEGLRGALFPYWTA